MGSGPLFCACAAALGIKFECSLCLNCTLLPQCDEGTQYCATGTDCTDCHTNCTDDYVPPPPPPDCTTPFRTGSNGCLHSRCFPNASSCAASVSGICAWDADGSRTNGGDCRLKDGLKRTNVTILVESLTPESVFTAARHAPHPPPASAASQPARSGAAGQKFGAEECKLLGAAARTVER